MFIRSLSCGKLVRKNYMYNSLTCELHRWPTDRKAVWLAQLTPEDCWDQAHNRLYPPHNTTIRSFSPCLFAVILALVPPPPSHLWLALRFFFVSFSDWLFLSHLFFWFALASLLAFLNKPTLSLFSNLFSTSYLIVVSILTGSFYSYSSLFWHHKNPGKISNSSNNSMAQVDSINKKAWGRKSCLTIP